jgi:hypothetical protein
MLPAPAGWSKVSAIDAVLLVAPGGVAQGQMRYEERVSPVRPFPALVEEVLRADPGFALIAASPPVRLVTDEGEFAALTRIDGTRDGAPAFHTVGAVLGDGFAAVLDATATNPTRFVSLGRLAEDSLRKIVLGLGRRRRLYAYAPPPGWQAIPTGLVANWYPPGYPDDATHIVVYPANPTEARPVAVFDEMLREDERSGWVVARRRGPYPVENRTGLVGEAWALASAAGEERRLVVFAHAGHLYSVRLASFRRDLLREHERVLADLVDSIEPLPVPGHGAGWSSLGAFWVQ